MEERHTLSCFSLRLRASASPRLFELSVLLMFANCSDTFPAVFDRDLPLTPPFGTPLPMGEGPGGEGVLSLYSAVLK
jgi:hypothetical protein